MGRTFLDIDMVRAADLLGMERRQAERIRELERGHFLALGPAITRLPLACKIGPVKTGNQVRSEGLMALPDTAPEDMAALLTTDLASDVAKALRFNMSLKQLSLSRNNIGAAGATALAKLFTRAPRSEELDNARENAVTAIASRNAAIEEFNVEMKAKKMPGLELITTQPKEMIELEEGAGFVYPGNGVLELLNLSSNPGLDGLCVLEIADALAQAAGVGESALKALAVQMTAALRDADTAAQLREKLSAAACLLET